MGTYPYEDSPSLHDLLPGPIDGVLKPNGDSVLDRIHLTSFQDTPYYLGGRIEGTLAYPETLGFELPWTSAIEIVFLQKAGQTITELDFELEVWTDDFAGKLTDVNLGVRFHSELIKPAKKEQGEWVVDSNLEYVQINAVVSIGADIEGVYLDSAPGVSIPPFAIGDTGIVVEASLVQWIFRQQDATALPASIGEKARGVYIENAAIHLPKGMSGILPNDVTLKDLFIGPAGFSGKVSGAWAPTLKADKSGFEGTGAGEIFGIPFGLTEVSLEFVQNSFKESTLTGQLLLPFFDEPVDVELGIDLDGNISAKLTSTAPGGLKTITKSGALRMELDSLGFELKDGVFLAKLSGLITPLAGGINWPSFDVRELSIDSKGHIHLDGGWFPLPKSYSIDFHGAKLEITQFGMGKTDDGGRYIGMSGAVELVKGIGGASVEGLRISWHPQQPGVNVTLNGIGIAFKTPALSFDGHVSYTKIGADHQFKGDLTVLIPAANNLKLVGKAVFGTNKGTKYFAIYLEGEFGIGLPLGATGLAMYGLSGLLAVNYAPDKPGTMLWYSINHANSYFHKPLTGVTDIIHKWKPEADTFAIGAGIRIGTLNDKGFAFNGNFLLLLLTPGPVLMLDGSAAVLRKLSDHSEPPFHGLIVWDNKAGYFMVGLDFRWKKDAAQGDIADISGGMEVFFNFHDPEAWHLWLGRKDPKSQRIQARFAKAFTANAYFMLDAHQLAVGVWIGSSKHYKWGPVGADMEAWMAADALVSFKPAHFHADIEFYGHFAIKVFKFHLAIGLDAKLAADVAKPFHIKGALDITIETRIKDFHIHMALEWGPRIDPPELHVPHAVPPDELAVVQSWGIMHSISSNEWPLQLAGAVEPAVPVDGRPYFTFAFPMVDAHGVGVNSAMPDPKWSIIGDPVTGAGSAQAKFSLDAITLYRVVGNTETPIAAHPKPANAPAGFGDIYGAWAPTIPGTSSGQNKLMLWSANPLDFADDAGSWNPWLSSNLPGYPCPDTKPETICLDFEAFAVGQQLHGSGWHSQNLDFQLAWSDAGPHPIVAAPSAGASIHGLLFAAAGPRNHYRSYISNFGDNTVSLVDLATRKVVATIPVGAHPRQVVLSPDGKRAYVCNQDDNTVIVIDTATNQRVGAPVAIIQAPVSIAISHDGKRAFVPSGAVASMSVIDLQSLQVTQVQLRAVANQAILSPDGKKVYVTHGPNGAISVFAADTLKIIKVLSAPGGPAAMVFHPSAPRGWVSFPSRGTVRLFDTGIDELAALETPTGKFVRDLALSPDGRRLYAGNLQDNTVSVLDTLSLDVIATIPTPGPAGLQMTPDGAALLIANTFANTFAIIDPLQNQVVAQGIAAGQGGNSFAVLQAPTQMLWRALVANQSSNTVSILDLQTGTPVTSIAVGRTPRWIALTPDGMRAYVCNQDDNTVTVIDTAAGKTVGAPISGITGPDSIAITSDGKKAFVMSGINQTMSVIDLALARITATVTLPGGGGNSITLSADGMKGYAICGPAHAMAIFSPGSLTVTKIVAMPGGGQYIALHPNLPRAFVSFPDEGAVREFDTGTEQFTGIVIKTGAWAQHPCFSPDGYRLYVCNFRENSISVIDSATNRVTATIPNFPGPTAPVFTSNGSMLVVASYTGFTVSMIDPVTNKIIGNPVPTQSYPTALVLQGTARPGQPLPPVPVDVTIDVPAGSSSVEVTWIGAGPLRGAVTAPFAQTKEVVAAAGSNLKLDVAVLDPAGTTLALSGIDQIRLRCDGTWTLLRVCVTRLPFAGGLAAQQTLNSAFHQQVDVLKKPTFLLDPGQKYKLRLDWSASVKGMGDLQNWSESFSNFTELGFSTALPPSLGTVSDTNVPPRIPSTVKGLDDLSLYVRRTIPVTQPANDQLPVLTKPVFRGYDVTVEFNENYVDQLYLMAGRDLDLILFDRNNEAVRDALGQLIIVEDAWGNAPTLTLTNTQALWIEMFNANTCGLTPIDPMLIPTSKVLRASDAHVLAADSVYEARLVPQLAHQAKIVATGWTTAPFAAGALIYNPGTLPVWTDYRVSVLITLATSDPVGILFGTTGNGWYEFTIDPAGKRRRLTQVSGGAGTTIREDYYVYNPGQDDPYRIRIEAVGSRILISQNGAVVFNLANAASLTGTAGLRPPAAQSVSAVFTDFGVSDLRAGAPVAWRFHFTTSKFTNFYHQIHSFQDRLWAKDQMTPLDLSAAVSSLPTGELLSAPPAQTVTDMEIRAYDKLALQVLGSASAQDPPQVEVTRVAQASAIFGWLVRSPEPVDYTRVQIALAVAPRALARGIAPGAVKISEAELGDAESVTLLARETIDLTGYRVECRQMPSALADELGSQIIRQGGGSSIASNQTWTDYRASVICRSKVAGGIGIQFRYLDNQNFYTFTYDFTNGMHSIVRMKNGTSTELASVSGDPAPGIPDAPAVLLTISVLGSQLTCYRAGKKVLQISDSTFPVGGAGVFSGGNSSAQFDSFDVHRLPNESYALLQGHFSTSALSGWLAATDGSGLELNVISGSAWTNAILRVRIKQNAAGIIGLMLRYQNVNNHYRLLFTNKERRLERVVGGVVTILWRSALATAMNRSNEIVVSLLDTTLSVFQNSILACEIVDASFASGNIGLCRGPGADFVVSQLVLYPPEFTFSNWTVQDEFQKPITDRWTLLDEGNQNGPSNWQVANGRLTQTSAILDSGPDPIRQRGTLALCKGRNPAESRLVMRLRTEQAGAIGVVFGYQDANNFYRLSMNATADSNARYRRLVRYVNGTVTVLWADMVVFDTGREYVLTLDVIDGYATAWLDGEQILECKLPGAVVGSVGLYCYGNTGASFANFRVGAATWNTYHKFDHQLPLSAGNRVKIASAVAAAPNRRTSVRLAAELDDTAINRLAPAGAYMRVVAPDQTVQHSREFIPNAEFANVPFQALRKADGTGIFLTAAPSVTPDQTARLSFRYQRDNGVVAFTEAGESGDELVFIDLPTV
ncbi:beta-propeller fold lactonase family protein [Bradyrhizobium sp.]